MNKKNKPREQKRTRINSCYNDPNKLAEALRENMENTDIFSLIRLIVRKSP